MERNCGYSGSSERSRRSYYLVRRGERVHLRKPIRKFYNKKCTFLPREFLYSHMKTHSLSATGVSCQER
ncbi:hypothetical protein HZ326_19484 [Fusarium oxysporum f. sp. albedinis]|nr:hypothetical protein HZ326_19484 [Fusarium oxysporum f. sp. albedinis]